MGNEQHVRGERIEVRRSRARILKAAETLFETQLPEPTMSELAATAGVSSATLYRRFPTIEAVIVALHDQLMEHFEQVAREAAREQSGWDALVTAITGIAHTIGAHPAIPSIYRKMAQLDPDYQLGPQWDAMLMEIGRRAHAEGMLRPDAEINDATMAAFRIGEYGLLPEPARTLVISRQLAIVIDGLRASSATTAVPGVEVSTENVNAYIHIEAARKTPDRRREQP
ncbi:MAG: TetR/AcrR family transcriptional regulator [Actinobacteria bacterium]|nr:TetR/AcrR family transcriptional regulator [Actinomycetota bacterium]